MKTRRIVGLLVAAAATATLIAQPASANVDVSEPADPGRQPSSGPGGGSTGVDFDWVDKEINGVFVRGLNTPAGTFEPHYIPWPQDNPLADSQYKWVSTANARRDCSLYYEVWRFTGPVSNPTELTTVSHALQPDVCDNNATRPVVFAAPHPHDISPATTPTNANVPAQSPIAGVGSPWEQGTDFSLENTRSSVLSPLNTTEWNNTLGTTPPFRRYKGTSCSNYQTGTHQQQLNNPDPSAWIGTTYTQKAVTSLERVTSLSWALAVHNSASGQAQAVDGVNCSSNYDFVSDPADETAEHTVSGTCYAEVRAEMRRFDGFNGVWPGQNNGKTAWSYSSQWDHPFYYNVNGSGSEKTFDEIITAGQASRAFNAYEAVIAAELASRTYTPASIAAVLGELPSNTADVSRGADCFIGSQLGSPGRPPEIPPCQVSPDLCPQPEDRCDFGDPGCPPFSLGGEVEVALAAFDAGQVGGKLKNNEYLLSVDSISAAPGARSCGNAPQMTNPGSEPWKTSVVVGPCVSDVSLNNFDVEAPSGHEFMHPTKYSGQNLKSRDFRGNLHFVDTTSDNELYRWNWSPSRAEATWKVYGWQELTGPCTIDPTVTCHLGWQAVSRTVSGSVPISVSVEPSVEFPVQGPTLDPRRD